MTRGPERDYLAGSRIAAWALGAARAFQSWWRAASNRVLASRAVKTGARSWSAAPLRVTGILLVSAVLTNGLTLWLLREEIDAGGIVLRALILLAGLAATRCGGDATAVREGSFFLRLFFPRKER